MEFHIMMYARNDTLIDFGSAMQILLNIEHCLFVEDIISLIHLFVVNKYFLGLVHSHIANYCIS